MIKKKANMVIKKTKTTTKILKMVVLLKRQAMKKFRSVHKIMVIIISLINI